MIVDNLQEVRAKIKKTLQKLGHESREVKLIVVTKTHSAQVVDEAIASGAKYIGENKVQEAEQKLPLLQQSYQEFHFIGHLQSNKINKLLALKPALIHSLDKLSTAKKLDKALASIGRKQKVLVQINTSQESSKSGACKSEAFELVAEISKLPSLEVEGLMTIGSLSSDVQETKRCFVELAEIFQECKLISTVNMKYLSMGMSGDYPLALECGANMLRVGSSIFGQRDYK